MIWGWLIGVLIWLALCGAFVALMVRKYTLTEERR